MASDAPDPTAPPTRRADIPIALALATFAVVLWAPLLRCDLNLGDEGWIVTGTRRLLDGEVLYRDFVRTYMPGVFWSLAPFFQLFGESVVVMRGVALAELTAVAMLAFWIARPLVPRWMAIWCGLFPIFLRPPYHKMFVPLSVLAGLWLCQRLITKSSNPRRTLAVGIGLGLIGLLRQEVAGYATLIAVLSVLAVELGPNASLGTGPTVVRRVIKSWTTLSAGILIIWLPVIALLAAQGALADVFDQLVLLGLRGNVAMELPYPSITTIVQGPERLMTSLYFFPILMVIVSALVLTAALARRTKPLERRQIVLAQWALMALLTHSVFLHRSGFPHLKQVLPASTLILAYLTSSIWYGHGARGARRVLMVPLIGTWCIALLVWGATTEVAAGYRDLADGERFDHPGAPVILSKERAELYGKVLNVLNNRSAPDDPIFIAPHGPMFYFMSDRVNPTRHDSVWPGFASNTEVQREIIADLDAANVNLILIVDAAPDGVEEHRFPAYVPEFAQYLVENFAPVRRVGHFVFYERRTSD
ncbi:MAG: hypothetical protein ACI8QZ_002735 [Chlamydiales bacterium]